MSGLAALQREFVARLFAMEAPADARSRLFRDNALANLAGALAATYPVVRRLVGEAFFGEAARRHALAVPSTSGDLNAYGAMFAAFLADYAPARSLEYLADVARLEWALHECDQAAEAPRLDTAALARIANGSEGEVRLALHPAVRLVASAHPVLAIWEANQPGRDGTLDREPVPECVLVHRTSQGTQAQAIDAASHALVEALARGAPLDAACDALGAEAGRLPELLARLAGMGILRDGVVPA